MKKIFYEEYSRKRKQQLPFHCPLIVQWVATTKVLIFCLIFIYLPHFLTAFARTLIQRDDMGLYYKCLMDFPSFSLLVVEFQPELIWGKREIKVKIYSDFWLFRALFFLCPPTNLLNSKDEREVWVLERDTIYCSLLVQYQHVKRKESHR